MKKTVYCAAALPGGRVYSYLALHVHFQLPFKGIYRWQLTCSNRRVIPVMGEA